MESWGFRYKTNPSSMVKTPVTAGLMVGVWDSISATSRSWSSLASGARTCADFGPGAETGKFHRGRKTGTLTPNRTNCTVSSESQSGPISSFLRESKFGGKFGAIRPKPIIHLANVCKSFTG